MRVHARIMVVTAAAAACCLGNSAHWQRPRRIARTTRRVWRHRCRRRVYAVSSLRWWRDVTSGGRTWENRLWRSRFTRKQHPLRGARQTRHWRHTTVLWAGGSSCVRWALFMSHQVQQKKKKKKESRCEHNRNSARWIISAINRMRPVCISYRYTRFLFHPAPLSLLGRPCVGNSECAVTHSLCLAVDAAARDLNFTCQCKENYVHVDGICVPREY